VDGVAPIFFTCCNVCVPLFCVESAEQAVKLIALMQERKMAHKHYSK